ncbi:bifunctional aminoglycoside phosphotransferase/ATP-binding protein [Crateriforma spongiae]|uniref:bifunctional aminoglycoside phosphotransferase/ATP-binding protein n=1 Tax=Crateriforma spongiae TaxID=2724528 RepID=UPI001447AD22|nr:bifunctional aminoglycoside phosphotransferase/ATP-binding protein [Crateriforma spongiae]
MPDIANHSSSDPLRRHHPMRGKQSPQGNQPLHRALRDPSAFPDHADGPVEVHETHISWVFLVGSHAYKVKKPIRTDFLDYTTLAKRKFFCEEELRLNRRFAPQLYLDVVPIRHHGTSLRVETPHPVSPMPQGDPNVGEVVDYAVRMVRFPDDALLNAQLAQGLIHDATVQALAKVIAQFHQSAGRVTGESAGSPPNQVLSTFEQNLNALAEVPHDRAQQNLDALVSWMRRFVDLHGDVFAERFRQGFVRECHGDLHLANLIHWRGQLTPFDGIEFCKAFRCIDVLCDAAFVAMDFAARGRMDFCRAFANDYLDRTGDHESLHLLRWYLIDRALVRAKVAWIRSRQQRVTDSERHEALDDCVNHIDLAEQFSRPTDRRLWITHGFSGSGKSTLSRNVVKQCGAIRIRSDVERKRHFGLQAEDRPRDEVARRMYSPQGDRITYNALFQLAETILNHGDSVVVDATFLRRACRMRFLELAERTGAHFGILDCQPDDAILRQRLQRRSAHPLSGASDADLSVLDHQQRHHDPLDESELYHVVQVPDERQAGCSSG